MTAASSPPRFATRERPLPPLHEAAWSSGVAAVQALLEGGADAVTTYGEGDTALHWAAAAGDVASVGMLLAAGASVAATSVNRHGWSDGGFVALHWAASGGDVATVRALLTAGTPVDALTDVRATALHCAAEAGQVAVIRALVDAGASVEARTDYGETPMHCAAFSGAAAALETLLVAGASVGATSISGLTPLHMVGCGDDAAAVQILLHAGASAEGTTRAVNVSAVDEVSFLGNWWDWAEDRSSIASGVTPLHTVAGRGNVTAVQSPKSSRQGGGREQRRPHCASLGGRQPKLRGGVHAARRGSARTPTGFPGCTGRGAAAAPRQFLQC